jgi:hypothetical protein
MVVVVAADSPPRNQYVASILNNESRIGTLLVGFLTDENVNSLMIKNTDSSIAEMIASLVLNADFV